MLTLLLSHVFLPSPPAPLRSQTPLLNQTRLSTLASRALGVSDPTKNTPTTAATLSRER